MNAFRLTGPEETVVHLCDSFRQDDWIIFRCPSCRDYERKINWRTGEVQVKNSREDVLHEGSHIPHGLDTSILN